MARQWIRENPPYWDEGKEHVIGGAPDGALERKKVGPRESGALLAGDWYRVEEDGETVGYGWMDTTWGDAEILLAVRNDRQGQGLGTYIIDHLEDEARERGLHYLYNAVAEAHPSREDVSAWLERRRFSASEDGRLLRRRVQLTSSPPEES